LRYAGAGKGLMAQNGPRSPQSLEYYSGWPVGSRVFLPFFPQMGVSLGVGRPPVSEISASSQGIKPQRPFGKPCFPSGGWVQRTPGLAGENAQSTPRGKRAENAQSTPREKRGKNVQKTRPAESARKTRRGRAP